MAGSWWLQRAVSWSDDKGAFQLQVHPAPHSTATRWAETGRDRIIERYDLLGPVVANPVVALNRAVAITERDGPEHGLAVLGAIVGMERSHLFHAALADNLRRLGRAAEAAGELETAAAFVPAEGERRLLLSRLLGVRPSLPDRFQGCWCPLLVSAFVLSPNADPDLGDHIGEESR
jgi:predicted RNA polymerase sigma factor